ncbi:MAG: ribosomal protein S18-alanine N-acetyltransferase [Anaerolineales bacterium]|nr:ribosomal protein S18-alanine N-acetyltransferase [Anaerolineales bacterium]
MTLADIPAVAAIERASYSLTWPIRAFDYELRHNTLAHYYVLRTSLAHPPTDTSSSTVPPETLSGQRSAVSGQSSTLIGLAGFWLMADEAHISTIAVHPDWRGLGLGEWLLLALLEAGQVLGAETATLEVRPSNEPALALYQKYQFEEVGRRPRYYSDNDEDALIFTTPPLALPDYQAMLAQRKIALFERLLKIEGNKPE